MVTPHSPWFLYRIKSNSPLGFPLRFALLDIQKVMMPYFSPSSLLSLPVSLVLVMRFSFYSAHPPAVSSRCSKSLMIAVCSRFVSPTLRRTCDAGELKKDELPSPHLHPEDACPDYLLVFYFVCTMARSQLL